MEKICSWLWRPVPTGPQQEDSFWWNQEDGWVYLSRGGAAPTRAYRGQWMFEMLCRKNYERLMQNMKAVFDFLYAKIGG